MDRDALQSPLATVVARGSAALLIRQVLAFAASFGTSLALARLLTPSQLGMVAVFVLTLTAGRLLVESGLPYSLIRQDAQPTDEELLSVAAVQLFTAAGLVLITILAMYAVPGFYPAWFDRDGLALVAASMLAVPPVSVCTALIERRLDFSTLGLVSLVQPLTFALVGVTLVLARQNTYSVALALAVSMVIPIPVALWAAHHKFSALRFSIRAVPHRWRLGAPITLSSLISIFKDSINPVVLPWMLGIAAVGYISWAQQLAAVAVYALAILSTIYFPVFSRLRADPRRLKLAVAMACFWASGLVAPVAAALLLNTTMLVDVIYGSSWNAAVPTLRLLLFANVLSPIAGVLIALFNANGRPSVGLSYTVAWAIATWAIVPILAPLMGIAGYGVANILVTLISGGLVWQAREFLTLRALLRCAMPWAIALLSAASSRLLLNVAPALHDTLLGVLAYGIVLLALYGVTLSLLCAKEVQLLKRAWSNS